MKKLKFDFPAQIIIENNLGLQSIQRTLSRDYKIYTPKLETLTSNKFISIYSTWDTKRKEDFVRTVAGKINFKKVKTFFDNQIGENI
jgi:hypothetical protein